MVVSHRHEAVLLAPSSSSLSSFMVGDLASDLPLLVARAKDGRGERGVAAIIGPILSYSVLGKPILWIMDSSSSDPGMKPELGGAGSSSGGGESSEAAVVTNDQMLLYRGLKKAKKDRGCTAKERISKMPPCTAGKRSSIYRGVTRHRWTGRYEAHLWDKSTWNQNQNKKGKQGAYDEEEAAARAYDLAALKYWGPGTLINFPVSDYTRDLDEMQNVSREEYLASLRSNRWDLSIGRMTGPGHFSNVNYGDNVENEYIGGFCMDRKIDLTSYIKWWAPSRIRQVDSISRSSEDPMHSSSDDVARELRTLEWAVRPTQPFQMPQLGFSSEPKKDKVSALSLLSQSAAYKQLQDKASKRTENNDENENKTTINKMDYDKSAADDKSTMSHGNSSSVNRVGAGLGMSPAALSLHRNMYPLTSFLSGQLVNNYNGSVDPLADPLLWTSLVPVLPSGMSRNPEVTKSEASSTYTLFQPED
ncbi:unnamed protein product [Linum tenue]|uniref:AP2/ERF domain-containing protein n=1 Tax=Linum tenue TaxID=586396 RepID=A0AAV0KA38_9ROSI|nr:unnamed protein product [Linum tenue]